MKKIVFILVLSLSLGFTHEKHAKESDLTLKQVMQKINQSAMKLLQGFLLDNDILILEGAKEIAEHPMPKGGPLMYIDPVKREEFARLMPAFERQVHGSGEDIVKFIKEGKKNEAFNAYTSMLKGCMGCHELFRKRY